MKIKGTEKIRKLAAAILMTSMAVTAAGCTVQLSENNNGETSVVETEEEETEKVSESASESMTEESSEIVETAVAVVDSGEETVVLYGVETNETQDEEEHDQAWIESQLAEGNIDNCSFTFEDKGEDKELITSWATYKVRASENEGKLTIMIDDKSYDVDVAYDWTGVRVHKAYLIKDNGNTYIYVVSGLEGDMTDINVYRIDDGSIAYVSCVERLNIFSDMNYPWEFLCYHYGWMNGWLSFYQYYTVGSDGTPVPSEDAVYLSSYLDQITLSEERTGKLEIYGRVTDQEITVSADELITPTETDFKTYIEVMDKDGNFIVFDCTDMFESYYESNGDSDDRRISAVLGFFNYTY